MAVSWDSSNVGLQLSVLLTRYSLASVRNTYVPNLWQFMDNYRLVMGETRPSLLD